MKIDRKLINSYPFTKLPLSEEEGGGFMVEYADLPGCVSDGDTPEDAVLHGRDAVKAYLLSCARHGETISRPAAASGANGDSASRGASTRASSREHGRKVSA